MSTGITVVQLLHRIARRSRDGDFSKLSLTEQGDVMEAAQIAMTTVYDALPIYFKELTEGFVLPGPLAITGVGVTNFGKVVTGANWTAQQFGCSVQLAGDSAWNQIVGPNLLQNPYMGPAGSVAGTVYGDSIFTELYPLDRVIGNPQFTDLSMGPLIRSQVTRTNEDGGAAFWLWQQTIGRPQRWWVQTYGNSQGGTPIMTLRFSPAPDQAYGVKVRLGLWPHRLQLADYQNATLLPCPDQFIEKALIPLGIKAFQTSPAYKSGSKDDEDRIEKRGNEGEAFLRGQPAQIGAPSNLVATPFGF